MTTKQFIKNYLLFSFLFLLGAPLFGQKATLTGKVIDGKTGEPLIGAAIVIQKDGQQIKGTTTDFDGNYDLEIDPETYDIEVSYVSYVKQDITGFEIKPGLNTFDVAMETETLELTTVTVTSTNIRSTDAALLSLQRRAFSIQDGLSSQQISRTGVSNAADAMKQMTGAVIEDGRFVVMRGLGDRYSLSQLNGITMPSTDPYRNSSSLDLIPSQMIENIITLKTFTPDLPGNFSGGIVNVNTKTFPDRFNLFFSLGTSYNTRASLNDNFLAHGQPGDLDRLGLDDGSRDQPAFLLDEKNRSLLSSSTYLQARNPSPDNDQVRDIFHRSAQELSNDFVPVRERSPLNTSVNFSIGNKVRLFGNSLGFTLGVNYSENYNYYDNATVATYINTNSARLFDYQFLQEDRGVRNPQLGALANLAYRFSPNHAISANVIFNNDAEIGSRQQSGRYLGQVSDPGASFNTNSLEYTQRQFRTAQLSGQHVFPGLNNTEIEWFASTTNSFQKEPDLRYFAYTVAEPESENPQYFINNAEFPFPFHFFRDLNDQQKMGKVDVSIPFLTRGVAGSSNRLKFGGLYSRLDRDFEEYRYQLNNTGVPTSLNFTMFNGDFDAFFDYRNFGIVDTTFRADGSIQRYVTGYHYINQNNQRNFYTGSEDILALYLMGIYNLTPKLKAIAGVRRETTKLGVISRDPNVPTSDIDLTDYLYSLNLIYSFSDRTNIRAAVSRTLARPNLRELAPFEQFDTKNGFFNVGNPNLTRTLIQNYDLRYEFYPRQGELIAVSAFYKLFDDPIIRAFNPRATIPELSFINIDEATVLGAELELRKNLDFLGSALENFFFSTNFALIRSEYNIPADEVENSRQVDPSYNTTTRPFQGQAPFIVNVILSYIDSDKGWESSLAFNVTGEKLYNIALFATPDIYEQPFPLLNFKLAKRFADHYQVSFTARNILDSINKKTQTFRGESYTAEAFRPGTLLGLSLSYSIR